MSAHLEADPRGVIQCCPGCGTANRIAYARLGQQGRCGTCKADLPPVADLVAAIAETGVAMTFPAGFALDENVGGWLPVIVDGAESGFDYGVFPLKDWPEDERPDGASELGDTVLSFGARGTLSAQTVDLIQQVLGRRWRAALWIEDEVLPPEDHFGPGASLAELHVSAEAPAIEGAEDMDPDLLATMRGTPAARAAIRYGFAQGFGTAGFAITNSAPEKSRSRCSPITQSTAPDAISCSRCCSGSSSFFAGSRSVSVTFAPRATK